MPGFRRLLIVLAIAITSPLSFAQSDVEIGTKTVAEALAKLKAKPGTKFESDESGWTLVSENHDRTQWLFTLPGDPAHPTVVKLTNIWTREGYSVEMRMLCEAAKAECDSLEADFKQTNAERTKAANGPLGADGKPIVAKVEKIDDDSFRLVHQSQRSVVRDAQVEIMPQASRICAPRTATLEKFSFLAPDPAVIGKSNPGIRLNQIVRCVSDAEADALRAKLPTPADAARPAGIGPVEADILTLQYFEMRRKFKYTEAFALLTPALQQSMPFDKWRQSNIERDDKIREQQKLETRNTFWRKDPQGYPPGTYAEIEFSGDYGKVPYRCGLLVWFYDNGTLRLVHEEDNIIDTATVEKLSPADLEKLRKRFRC